MLRQIRAQLIDHSVCPRATFEFAHLVERLLIRGNNLLFVQQSVFRGKNVPIVGMTFRIASHALWRFRLMRSQHSGAWEATIPEHEKPVRRA